MPAERRQVVSRIISPANGSVRPSRRRTTAALPSAPAPAPATTTGTPTSSVDFGHSTRSSAEFARGLDDAAHNAAGTTHPQVHAHAHAHAHAHNRNLSSSGFGGTGATTNTTNTTAVHHRSRPSISRASRPQSVYQIVEAYRPLAYSIEKAEQEAKAAAAEKRRSLVLSPLQTTTTTMVMPQPVPLAEDDAMDIDEFGQFSSATPTTAPPLVTPTSDYQFEEDDFAVLRSPTRGKQQEECISGRGMLKRGYHIILDTPLENSEEARWAAIKRMEAQLRELDKSFTRIAPPSRRRITNVTNHTSTTTAVAPSPASFSAANRAAWNI